MKIESLYEYIVLTHYLNFTTAAANLHTSQPNLSKHILELEQELGVDLLKRGKRLELTPAGTMTTWLSSSMPVSPMSFSSAVWLGTINGWPLRATRQPALS